MIRRCPQCGSAADDTYGFCIKCGYEFPKIEHEIGTCPLCQYKNPEEAEYCVKCGTPLFLKNQMNGNENSLNPIIIKKEVNNNSEEYRQHKTSSWIIILGYVFSILGGLLGLLIGIYLSTRKDPVARKHGHIQIAIFIFYLILILVLFATGNIPNDIATQYRQLAVGNFTFFQR